MELNNKVIICPNEIKRVFLSLKSKDPYLNVTLFSLNELQKQIFGSYDKEAISYLLQHTSYPIKVIKQYLNYIQRGIDVSVNPEVEDIYNILTNNNFLEVNDLIKELFKNNEVLIIGYAEDNIELKHILDLLAPKQVAFELIDNLIDKHENNIIKFNTIDEEIRYIFNTIIEEEIKASQNGLKVRKKYIVCDDNKYEPYLRTYAKSYKIKLYFKNSKSIAGNAITKGLLNEALVGNDLNSYLNSVKETANEDDLNVINSLEQLINDYLVLFNDGTNVKYVDKLYDNLRYLVDEVKVVEPHYKNELIVTSKIDLNPNVDYYLLGASDIFVPSLKKNNQILDDSVLESNGINSSRIANIEIEELTKAFIFFSSIKHISYYEKEGKDINYTTNFIESKNIIEPNRLYFDYSKESTAAYYSRAVDVKKKYNEHIFDLNYKDELISKDVDLDEYDSSFTGINKMSPSKKISFSYTSLTKLYSCPFAYYLDYVLHIGIFEDTFNSKLGKFVHKMFEHVVDYDFFKSYDLALNEFKDGFDKKELFLLEANKKRIKFGYDNLRKQIYTRDISKSEHEYSKTYNVNDGDSSLTVNGSIDNFVVLYPEDKILILDYKTGSYFVGNDEDYNKGLHLQLLMYSYMLYKDKDYKDKEIAGIYYCPMITKELNMNSQKFVDSYKLDGITFSEGVASSELMNKRSLKISPVSVQEYRELVDMKVKEAKDIVMNSNFNILPVVDKRNDACKFCEYYSICFKDRAKENVNRSSEEEENSDEE